MHKQALLLAPRQIEIREKQSRALAPWEARIRVEVAGVCGTDVAIYKGDYRVALPLVLGHEFCGTVIETGAGVQEGLAGKRCTAEINNSCLVRDETTPCEACKRGMPTHCQTRTTVGITEWDGAFAEEIIVPAKNIHEIPDSIGTDAGIFIEPLAAAIQTFEMSPIYGLSGSGEEKPFVVVLGVGRLGVLVAAVAHSLGARVIGVSHSRKNLDRAAPYCDTVIAADRPDKVVTFVRQQTNGLGADYVVEATASPLGVHFAAQLVRPRGVIALKSTPGTPVDRLNLTALVVNEIRLQGSRCGPFDKAIEFLKGTGMDLSGLIDSRFPLDETANAMHLAENKGKVLIQCNE